MIVKFIVMETDINRLNELDVIVWRGKFVNRNDWGKVDFRVDVKYITCSKKFGFVCYK